MEPSSASSPVIVLPQKQVARGLARCAELLSIDFGMVVRGLSERIVKEAGKVKKAILFRHSRSTFPITMIQRQGCSWFACDILK
jgi:hypothetical protein